MKKFTFPLQSLLDYRQRKENRLKKELSEIKKEWEKEREILEKFQINKKKCEQELREKRESKEINISLILLYQSHLDRIINQIAKQKRKVADISLKLKNKRKQIIEASKERKIVEKLREKKWLKFTEAIEKAEQHFIDEIALAKFHSKKSRGDQCIP
ncbi:flagellar export protein FliJ [Candidatus Aerophobetes bacterium]|nr:flagellar export protein FliJ [Candidatus Aerophobetes bacterium]